MTDETPDAPTDNVDVVVQPTLPTLELPDYHGRKPIGMKTSVNGAGNRLSTAHEIDERVVLVVEARVKKAGHEQTDDGLVYTEVLKVADLFEVQGEPGKRLLSTVRQAYRESDDDRLGRQAFPLDEGVKGVTDESGTVLTPAELAERRGDPASAIGDDRLSPVVVVYSDGARELWPDEFDPGAPRPVAGERFEIEGQEGPTAYAYVKELLHAETGEVLAEWTLEQEADRLLEMEEAAEAAEQADARTEAVYYRVEHESGAVTDLDPGELAEYVRADGDRIVAIDDGGFEWEIPVPETPTFKAVTDDDLEPIDGEAPLPGEDGYGDGLEPLEKDDAEPVDDPLADVLEFPAQPQPDDFTFVDTDLDILRAKLPTVEDLDQARRILEAERQGRGRKLKTRKGAVDSITARIAELEKAPADA